MINQRHDDEGLVVQLQAGKCKYCLFLVRLPSLYYLFKQTAYLTAFCLTLSFLALLINATILLSIHFCLP